MLALRKLAAQPGLALVEAPAPQAVSGTDVLIEVEAAGICGSDLHVDDCFRGQRGPRRELVERRGDPADLVDPAGDDDLESIVPGSALVHARRTFRFAYSSSRTAIAAMSSDCGVVPTNSRTLAIVASTS